MLTRQHTTSPEPLVPGRVLCLQSQSTHALRPCLSWNVQVSSWFTGVSRARTRVCGTGSPGDAPERYGDKEGSQGDGERLVGMERDKEREGSQEGRHGDGGEHEGQGGEPGESVRGWVLLVSGFVLCKGSWWSGVWGSGSLGMALGFGVCGFLGLGLLSCLGWGIGWCGEQHDLS